MWEYINGRWVYVNPTPIGVESGDISNVQPKNPDVTVDFGSPRHPGMQNTIPGNTGGGGAKNPYFTMGNTPFSDTIGGSSVHPDVDLWQETHPPRDPNDGNPPNRPIHKAPDLSGNWDIDIKELRRNQWKNQCPFIEAPCLDENGNDVSEKIKNAWADAMYRIDHADLSSWENSKNVTDSSCGARLKNIIECMKKALNTDFSKLTPNANPGSEPQIVIFCDPNLGQPGKTVAFNGLEIINLNTSKNDMPLDAVIVHELVHACTTKEPGDLDNVDSELEAFYFESLVYGSHGGANYPLALNQYKKTFPFKDEIVIGPNNPNWQKILKQSKIVKDTKGLASASDNFVMSNFMVFDVCSGNVYCLDPDGKIDRNHPLPRFPGDLGAQRKGLMNCP